MTKGKKRAEAHYNQGLQHNSTGNWGFAEEEFLKALAIYTKLKDWDQVVQCRCSLGNVLYNKGDIPLTRKHWEEALSVWDNLNRKTEAGELCIDIGDLFLELDKLYGAGEYYEKALSYFREEPLGNDLNIADANCKLGDVCLFMNRYDDAEMHYEKAYPFYEKHNDLKGQATVLKRFGELLFVDQEYKEAKEFLLILAS